MALPLLDAMMPAFGARRPQPVAPLPDLLRAERHGDGVLAAEDNGADFELTPILEPLAPFRNQMLVLSGLKANWNYIHAGASGSFLTGTTRGGRTEVEIIADVSMDQLLARHFASETQVASLELAMDPANNAGACTGNLSCVYTHTLSWRSKTQPLPMEFNPRAVFEKLFGDSGSTDRAAREARLRQHQSILDSVNEKLASLKRSLGPAGSDQGQRVRRVGPRRRAAHPEGRGAAGSRAADDGSAAGRAADLRRSPGADARPAAARVPVRSDARHLVHDQQGTERASVSADRRARSAPSAVASRRPARADRAHVEDQPVSHRAVLRSTWRSCARRRMATARCWIT